MINANTSQSTVLVSRIRCLSFCPQSDLGLVPSIRLLEREKKVSVVSAPHAVYARGFQGYKGVCLTK